MLSAEIWQCFLLRSGSASCRDLAGSTIKWTVFVLSTEHDKWLLAESVPIFMLPAEIWQRFLLRSGRKHNQVDSLYRTVVSAGSERLQAVNMMDMWGLIYTQTEMLLHLLSYKMQGLPLQNNLRLILKGKIHPMAE